MIDLHLHLDGSLTREELLSLAAMSHKPLESIKEARLSVDESCLSLNDYLECFETPLSVLQKKETIAKAVTYLIARLSHDGLFYAEIRFAPQLHTREGLSQREVVEAALLGLKEAKEQYLFPAQLILCLMRGDKNQEANMETVLLAKEYLDKGVCGIDLAGAEALYPTKDFAPFFQKARELDIPFTIHAGEAAGPESIWEALRFGARRIGHGVHAIKDKSLLGFLAATKIPLELCPTSEVDTHAIASIEDLPLREFMRLGIKVTINTDDMTVSNVTLAEEYAKLQKSFDLTEKEMRKLYENSIEAAFLSTEQKEFLFEKLEKLYEPDEA